MGGLVFFIVLVIFLVRNFTGKKGISGDQKDNVRGNYISVWVISILAWLIISNDHPDNYLAMFGLYCWLAVFCQPSIISKMWAMSAMYKGCYYIAALCYFRNGRNLFAGRLMCSLEACQRLKSDEEKRQALMWLKSRYQKRKAKKKILSGDMVAITIIEAYLAKPGDAYYAAAQLDLLKGIAPASIPRCVSRYALRLSLAPALANVDWEKVNACAKQWDTPAINPLARYIKALYDFYRGEDKTLRVRLRCFFWRLFFIFSPYLWQLPQQFKAVRHQAGEAESETDVIHVLWKNGQLTDSNRNSYRQCLLSAEVQQRWRLRSEQLGVWDENEAWRQVQQTVLRALPEESAGDAIADEQAYQLMEQKYKKLHYLLQAIERRLDADEVGSGVQNFLDWLHVRNLLLELSASDHFAGTAFSSNHEILWQWVADLWNVAKQHCLVHFMAGIFEPMAKQNGYTEFHTLLHGLTRAEYS